MSPKFIPGNAKAILPGLQIKNQTKVVSKVRFDLDTGFLAKVSAENEQLKQSTGVQTILAE